MAATLITVERGDNPVRFQEHARPVVLGIVTGDTLGEAGVGVGEITSEGASEESVGELDGVDIGRHHTPGDIVQLGTQRVVVTGEVTRLIRIGVDILVGAGAGGRADGQGCDDEFVDISFHC